LNNSCRLPKHQET